MDFINPNFEIRNKNSNSDNKKDIKKKQDISAGKNIQTNLAKPSGKLLQAYNKISFNYNYYIYSCFRGYELCRVLNFGF